MEAEVEVNRSGFVEGDMVEGATSFGLVMYVLNNCLNIGKKPSLGERELVSCGIGNECQPVVSRHVKEICMVVCVCVDLF